MCLRIISLQLLLLLLRDTVAATGEPKHCDSIELRSIGDFESIQNCTVIVGHVRIVNIDFDKVPAEQLVQTNIVEITDYLLVYRVHGLESLLRVFPQLLLIRGRNLLFNEYALIVFENRKLLNLGLVALKRIEQGSVRIEGNPELCYADTVNWIQLLRNSSLQHFSIKNNRLPNHCPTCALGTNEVNTYDNIKQHCWSKHAIQPPVTLGSIGNQCLNVCPAEATACPAAHCALCANLNQNGKCVENCGVMYFELNKRQCVTAANCTKLGKTPLVRGGLCLDRLSYENSDSVVCVGVYVIKTTDDLKQLRGCVTIRGSLILQLTETKSNIIATLEDVLLNLKEITGYLKIVHSPQLLSLGFLGNLDTIGGQELYANAYALYIVDNYHLEQIWRKNQKVAIIKGQIFFHLNPRLCYEKILALQPSLRSGTNITIMQASPNSNGERVICGSAVRKLNPIVEDVNATVVLITVENMPADDLDVLLGYQYYYKPAPTRNVTMYDGRHGCGHDDWRLDISASKNRRHLITNLKPYTQYAYFVRTITRVDYHKQIDAYSDIGYFRTLPSKPAPVAKIYYHSLSASEIAVHWWPPRIANGIIDRYIINFSRYEFKQGSSNETMRRTDAAEQKTCQCENINENTKSIPPNDENYYNKDEMTYEEALPNILFVARPIDVRNKPENEDAASKEAAEGPDYQQQNVTAEDPELLRKIEILENFRRKHEEQAREIQDADINTFRVDKPKPICDATSNEQRGCVKYEKYAGVSVGGNEHSYVIRKLEGQVTYRISVRACVKGLPNGCGKESVIYAETVSKRLETFFKSLNHYN